MVLAQANYLGIKNINALGSFFCIKHYLVVISELYFVFFNLLQKRTKFLRQALNTPIYNIIFFRERNRIEYGINKRLFNTTNSEFEFVRIFFFSFIISLSYRNNNQTANIKTTIINNLLSCSPLIPFFTADLKYRNMIFNFTLQRKRIDY